MMYTHSNRRRLMMMSIASLIFLVIGIITWRALANRAPGPDASAQDVRQFVASDEFRDLPREEKEKYAKNMDKLFEPNDEQQRAIRNMAELHRQKMLDDYFALPEGKARHDYLDKQIDEMEKLRKMMENPSTQPGEGKFVIKRGGPSAAAQKEMTETVPAEYQAKMAQYVKDMKDRRAARGLPTDGPTGVMIRIGGPG
jgi:hypothetical protein